MSRLYDVPAPAKLNLFLHVVGRRADGYHLLQTAFRFIGLADTLHFEERGDGVIERGYDLPGVPEEQDLVVRAARALQAAAGVKRGARIVLEKRIPQGGGLGGGSSDAAAALIALNRLWNAGLSRRELMALALPLGADVPVFVFGQSAFAEGVGEQLTAIDLPPSAYLVAQPQASVPTAEIFQAPDLTRDTSPAKIADFLAHPIVGSDVQPNANAANFWHNDLEPVVFARYPEVSRCAQWLAGRLKKPVRMSGSGACLYAEFADMRQAVLAEQEIVGKIRAAAIWACEGLDEHPLRHWISS
jgi:4-diphosphocytidyl-2-C-methyl-D-erythritol kinase